MGTTAKDDDDLRPPLLTLYVHARETAASPAASPAATVSAVINCLADCRAVFLQDFRSFVGDPERLWEAVLASAQSKFARLPKLERGNSIRFDDVLMGNQIATAVRAGMYTYFRDVFVPRSEVEDIANFYFLREFCFGYNGKDFRGKDFRGKAARLFALKTRALFADAQPFNPDLRAFFEASRQSLGHVGHIVPAAGIVYC